MARDVTPEWERVKREMQSLWQGAFNEIHAISDRLTKLERRVKKIETPTHISVTTDEPGIAPPVDSPE